MKIKKAIILSLIILSNTLPAVLLAQGGPGMLNPPPAPGVVNPSPSPSFDIPNPTKVTGGLIDLITAILNNIVLPIASVLVVLYIIYAGFTFVTAQGKPAEIEKAKQRLLWALVGAGILLASGGIAIAVQNTVQSLIAK